MSDASMSLSSGIENKVVQVVDSKLNELKKIITKVYALQKRTSESNKVRNSMNDRESKILIV
jgi:hypothetical protein